MAELSILIPARNEEFLAKTVENILENIEADTEILVGLDGLWAEPGLKDNPKVTLFYVSESIGQREMTNRLCRLSSAKYVMKIDAHCSFDKGFDRKMLDLMADDITMVPVMRNLHAFNWVCPCGYIHYQDKGSTCARCGGRMEKDILWRAKRIFNRSFCFDSEPHFQYFNEYTKRPEFIEGDLTETMSLQGSCFMLTREKYWSLKLDDPAFYSWGSQGLQVACSTWLSGGRVLVNNRTWYAHMFRTKSGNGFGFPYKQDESKVSKTRSLAKERLLNNSWPRQILPTRWLLEKFWPVKGWSEEDLKKLSFK